jgi:hypothetical protein
MKIVYRYSCPVLFFTDMISPVFTDYYARGGNSSQSFLTTGLNDSQVFNLIAVKRLQKENSTIFQRVDDRQS